MYPSQPNQGLIDGLAVLQALTAADEPVGTRELARDLDLNRTRVSRLLGTLAGLGLALQTEDRKYITGPGVHVLAAQALYGSGLISRALPVLEDLHETGFVVALGVLWRDQVCYLYHGTTGMRAADALGSTGLFPATKSGIGHVLLAELDDERLQLALGDRVEEWAPTLSEVKSQGWARVVRSTEPLEVTLAVPVGENPYAAVALAGAIDQASADHLLPQLKEAAHQISQPT